jgi:hypothetical protein
MEEPTSKNIMADLELLGQKLKFPINIYLVLIVLVIVAGISIIELKNEGVSRFVTIISAAYHTVGEKTPKDFIATTYEFWTPAAETFEDVKDIIKDQKKLQFYKTDNSILEAFGKDLKEHDIQGYTRYFGWGEGTEGLKRGWTWKITVPQSSPFTKDDLLELYKKYFHRDRDIYIEKTEVGQTRFSSGK